MPYPSGFFWVFFAQITRKRHPFGKDMVAELSDCEFDEGSSPWFVTVLPVSVIEESRIASGKMPC
jgi:hypothetical protein